MQCTVVIGKRAWRMDEKGAKALLELASSKVQRGIYALRKGADYYEIKNHHMTKSQMKRARNAYRAQGIKVYCNGL